MLALLAGGVLNAQIDCYPFNGKAAFVRSTTGHPWGSFGLNNFANLNSMDVIFGAGQWSDLRYETVNVPNMLNQHTFIYLEGGDNNAQELNTFLATNLSQLEAWVSAGNRLLINAAPNEGGNINLGFGGVTLVYDGGSTLSNDAIPFNPAHPVFDGINTNYFTGNYMGHSLITPTNMTSMLRSAGNANNIMLSEKDWGDGKIVFGGLTLPWYEMMDSPWGPQPDLTNFGRNILEYAASGDLECPPDCAGVPGGEAYIDACGVCVEGNTGETACIPGCTDGAACNYDPLATDDNGSCIYFIDCAGNCGGPFLLNDCGVCYDPTSDGIEVTEFFFTGNAQSFTVPFGVDSLFIEVFGAQGGGSTGCGGLNDNQDDGGLGGYSSGYRLVNQGNTFFLYVGGKGSLNGGPGWNGGGSGGLYAGGGGGASDVRTTLGFFSSRIIVGGGGGGGSFGCGADYGAGGNGGGLTGQAGIALISGVGGGGGGVSTGGVAGTSPSAAGTFGNGGSAAQTHVAGGGGGWYGGGAAYRAGGGGGSSRITGVLQGITQAGQQAGNGLVRITYRIEIPPCEFDCNADLNGTAYLDACGICVEGNTGLLPCVPGCTDPIACNYNALATNDDNSCAFVLDCNGTCGGTFVVDACGQCYDSALPAPTCILGCDGVLYTDPALVPSVDCFGVCGGLAVVDDCGVCGGDNSSCSDCAGVLYGTSVLNACGICYDPTELQTFTSTYNFTGSVQSFVVPSGVYSLSVQAFGAQGAASVSCVQGESLQLDGGLGGTVSGDFAVLPGQTYFIYIGGQGSSAGTGGWNGGGAGGNFGGGGGGATDMRTTLGNLASRVLVAGGGGAGNTGCPDGGQGGNGGGLTGAAGLSFVGNTGGGGGTQVSGGTIGTTPAQPGSFGNGGGVFGSNVSGGGGGWYGGGAAFRAGGGGGSSYFGNINNAATLAGVRTGNGTLTITYIVEPDCIPGCLDPEADNYNPAATFDDGSCIAQGCTNLAAVNYDPSATFDDGSCIVLGCTLNYASNYNPEATEDDGSCICFIEGCTDPAAYNYNPAAVTENGTCVDAVFGCITPNAINYDPLANTNDGSCVFNVYGCTDPSAANYNPLATADHGGCLPYLVGCMNPEAFNYNPFANQDDAASCILELCGQDTYWDPVLQLCIGVFDCPEDLNRDGLVNSADLLIFLSYFGTNCADLDFDEE